MDDDVILIGKKKPSHIVHCIYCGGDIERDLQYKDGVCSSCKANRKRQYYHTVQKKVINSRRAIRWAGRGKV